MTSTVKKSLLQEESEPTKTEDLYSAPVVQSLQYVVPKAYYYVISSFPSVLSHFVLACSSLGPALPLFLAKGPLLNTVCHMHMVQESSKPSAGIMQQDAKGILSTVQSPSENWPWLNLYLLYRNHTQHLCLAPSAKAKLFHTFVPFFCLYE